MRNSFELSGVALVALVALMAPAAAQSIDVLGGSDNGGASVTLGDRGSDNNLLDLDINDEPIADVGTTGGNLLGLGEDGSGATVDLFGPGEGGQTQLAIGLDGSDDDVLVNLFGSPGNGSVATANILPGGAGAGGRNEATIDLFGPDGEEQADPTQTGSVGNGNGGQPAGATTRPGNSVRVAAAGNTPRASGSCFSPDQSQISHLLNRSSYSGSVTASWREAESVSIVPVNICQDARERLSAAIDANANVGTMRSAVASNDVLKAQLGGRYQADDILAVDKAGTQLTVYVY